MVYDVAAIGLHREHQAASHRDAIDHHVAGAADAVFAADMRAGPAQRIADEDRARCVRASTRARRRLRR